MLQGSIQIHDSHEIVLIQERMQCCGSLVNGVFFCAEITDFGQCLMVPGEHWGGDFSAVGGLFGGIGGDCVDR